MSEPASPPRPPAPIAAAELPGLNGLMTLAVGVVVVAALHFAQEVLIPITLAVLLSFVLAPLAGRLRRAHLGRVPSVILAVLVALGLIVVVSGIIGSQVAQLAGDLPRYMTTIEAKLAAVRKFGEGQFFATLGNIGKRIEQANAAATEAKSDPGAIAAPPEPAPVRVEMHQPPVSPLVLAQRIIEPVIAPLATAAIVFTVAIFILLQQEDLRNRLIRLFGADDLHRATNALDDAARRLSKYLLTQLGLNTAFGIVIAAGLFVIGIPNPVLWGIAATLFRFVPYVGGVLSAVPPFILAASVDPGWSMLAWSAVLYVVAEGVTGQLIEPMIYGHSTGLSPVSVIVAAIFWGWLWGPVGLILSMPLTLCLVVLGRHVNRLQFLDVLLGDRPALTPVESFYQRMLAGDPDEAQDHAEMLLRERSLSSYYDEVALPGLLLAVSDGQRDVLTPGQVARIVTAFEELIDALSDHEDSAPEPDQADDGPVAPPDQERDLRKRPAPTYPELSADSLPLHWRSDTPILCMAGQGPFDRAAAMMMGQLLSRHGLKTRIVSSDAASRANIHSLDLNGIAMICMCYLDVIGNASHLRYLLRRLRHSLPNVPILVAIWPLEAGTEDQDRLRSAIMADFVASSLHDAVTTCLEVATQKQNGPLIVG